jgi:hypothetical protein
VLDRAVSGEAGVLIDAAGLGDDAFGLAAEATVSPPNRSLLYQVSKAAKAKAQAPAKRPADDDDQDAVPAKRGKPRCVKGVASGVSRARHCLWPPC